MDAAALATGGGDGGTNEELMRRCSVDEMLAFARVPTDPDGRYLLQEELARAKPSTKVIQELLSTSPDRIKLPNESGSLPLHVCAANIHSIERPILNLIVKAYPAALLIANNFGLTPLHKAVQAPLRSPPCINHIEYLIDLEPSCLLKGTKDLQLPLHLACSISKPAEALVEMLLEKNREAAASKDKRCQTALHKLCSKPPSEETINVLGTLIEANPDATRWRDTNGRTPLHIAVARDKPDLSLIGELIEAAPDSVLVIDNDGFKPLDVLYNRGKERCGASCLLLAQTEELEAAKVKVNAVAKNVRSSARGSGKQSASDGHVDVGAL